MHRVFDTGGKRHAARMDLFYCPPYSQLTFSLLNRIDETLKMSFHDLAFDCMKKEFPAMSRYPIQKCKVLILKELNYPRSFRRFLYHKITSLIPNLTSLIPRKDLIDTSKRPH